MDDLSYMKKKKNYFISEIKENKNKNKIEEKLIF